MAAASRARKKPRRRQGFEQERFWESVLVSTPEVGSVLLTQEKPIASEKESFAAADRCLNCP